VQRVDLIKRRKTLLMEGDVGQGWRRSLLWTMIVLSCWSHREIIALRLVNLRPPVIHGSRTTVADGHTASESEISRFSTGRKNAVFTCAWRFASAVHAVYRVYVRPSACSSQAGVVPNGCKYDHKNNAAQRCLKNNTLDFWS